MPASHRRPSLLVRPALRLRTALRSRPVPLARPSRRAATSICAAALAAVVGTGAVYAATATTVELRVDGVARSVTLHGDTVADVLRRAGVSAGEHDVLAPGPGARVRDGGLVALRRGRPLQLVVDGQERTVWVTADDVAGALDQIGLDATGAALSASRSRAIGLDGLALDVRLPKDAGVAADGGRTVLRTTAATVGDLLAETGVSPAPERHARRAGRGAGEQRPARHRDAPRQHAGRRGRRPGRRRRAHRGPVAGPRHRARHGAGQPRVGAADVRRDARRRRRDRPHAARDHPHRRAGRAAGRRRHAGRARAAPAAPSGTDGLDWAALARCESGGNPRAVGGGGQYFGLYQFSLGTWRGVGGSGNPVDASPAEQTSRAKILYSRSGRSPWPVCGRYL